MAKPQDERIRECLAILKKITVDIGIPANNPSIRTLKKRMAEYWRDGVLRDDKLPLYGYDRIIRYRLPQRADRIVEVTLQKVDRFMTFKYPADLQAELDADAREQQKIADAAEDAADVA